MSGLFRYASLRRLQVVLGLALMALVFAPSAAGATQLDTATATGSTDGTGGFFNISVDAHSGLSGESPGGSVSLGFFFDFDGKLVAVTVGGPVTCLKVAGNTAVIGFHDIDLTGGYGVVTLVDNGGSGSDLLVVGNIPGNPIDCSAPPAVSDSALNGRAVVFDAPDPTSTSVSCSPSAFAAGDATVCKATVTDTAGTGQSTPTGTVSFSSSGAGNFGGSPCTLSGRGGGMPPPSLIGKVMDAAADVHSPAQVTDGLRTLLGVELDADELAYLEHLGRAVLRAVLEARPR